jgi:predicted nucleic acid-binding Zn ribbon protein
MEPELRDVDARLNTHEAVCAERYAGINARLRRMEAILMGGVGAIFLMLLGIVLKMRV